MRSPLPILAAFIFASLVLSGCISGPSGRAPPEPEIGPGKLTHVEVQSELMSFADTFIGTVAEVWNQAESSAAATRLPTEVINPDRVRRASHAIKLANVNAAVSIAAGANPVVGVADMVTLMTLQRIALEEEATAATFGRTTAGTLAATYREQEAKILRVAERVFTPEERAELAAIIALWKAEHPTQRYVSGVRLEDYGRERALAHEHEASTSDSFLQRLGLQLDPATREVEKTRLLGERIFFYARHMPQILRWQGESFYMGFFQKTETQKLLASLASVSEAADRISLTVEQLPETIRAERTALINETFAKLASEREATLTQVFEGLNLQRELALKDFDAAQTTFNGTLKELQTTIAASDSLVGRVAETIGAADTLAQRFTARRTPSGPGADPAADAGPVRDPLTEFNAAAVQTAVTVEKLTELMARVEGLLSSPHWDRSNTLLQTTVASAEDGAKGVVDYAFWRVAILVVAGPLAVALAMGLYRRMVGPRPARS